MLSEVIAKILIITGIIGGTAYFLESIVRVITKGVKWIKERRKKWKK